jgi:glucokinase
VTEIGVIEHVIGVDLGGTHVRAAAVDAEGRIGRRVKKATEVHKGGNAVLSNIFSAVQEIRTEGPAVDAVGFGIPGPMDLNEGVVLSAPNIPFWKDFPIASVFEKELAVPVFIENDANAAALGEHWKGAGKGFQNMVCLTLGTGIGGGIIVDGRIVHGAEGSAAEAGHMVIHPDGPECNCGSRGCLETYCSATAIEKRARAVDGLRGLTTETIYRLALKGETAARELLEEAGTYLGIGLANLVNLLNPEAIVIGGGVAGAWDILIPPAEREMKVRAFKRPAERVRLLKAGLGDDAGILGAARTALEGGNR